MPPAKQQIVLIDADDIVRDSLKVLLESHGMLVRDFRTADDLLAAGGAPGDGCLVLGFNRTTIEGLDLLATLRRRGIRLPVIFVVGGGNASVKAAVLAAGACAYLDRPIEEAALIRTVRSVMALEGRRNDGTPAATAMAVR
jgi:two-component system response regulator FixJ